MHLREVENLRTSFNPGLGHACAGGKARELSPRLLPYAPAGASAASSVWASCRSGVSKPSVNQA